MAAALALGGCLWWVSNRQVGLGGASVALALYVSAPAVLCSGTAIVAALGLFAMLYTAVGVAHALQGPRRKWRARIALMALLCVFTAAAQPMACGLGLGLALVATLYLAERRRRVLPFLFTLWALASLASFLAMHSLGWRLSASVLHQAAGKGNAGLYFSVAAALMLWVLSSRSRYFGNSAPLLGACLLAASGVFVGAQAWVWALPFAFLFLAGVAADALDGRYRRFWVAAFAGVVVLQIVLGA